MHMRGGRVDSLRVAGGEAWERGPREIRGAGFFLQVLGRLHASASVAA